MRADAPLIKWLSKTYTPKLGFFWQQLPFVEFNASLNLPLIHRVNTLTTRDFEHLAWDDAVLLFRDALTSNVGEPNASIIARIADMSVYLRKAPRLSPWWEALPEWTHRMIEHAPDPAIVLETWMLLPEGILSDPDVLIVDPRGDEPGIHMSRLLVDLVDRGIREGLPRDQISELAGELLEARRESRNVLIGQYKRMSEIRASLVLSGASYLTQSPEYLVETLPSAMPRRERRPNDPKPWTYDHLPTIVLLDPTEAPSGESGVDRGGTHASPRPHQRRGHWRTLASPRFREPGRRVFVKPSWVGPREWIMQGTRYRVVEGQGD